MVAACSGGEAGSTGGRRPRSGARGEGRGRARRDLRVNDMRKCKNCCGI